MKKRESELSRKKYRESYIYSDNNECKANKNGDSNFKLDVNWMEYQQEPASKHLVFNKENNSNSNSLTASRNTLVSKEILNLSQNNYHLSPLSDEMKPIMEKFDRQISKMQQFNSDANSKKDSDLINLSNSQLNNEKSIKTDKPTDQVDFMNGLDNLQFYNQLNTNPFLNKSDYNNQISYFNHQSKLENLDEFVIEHKEEDKLDQSKLTVQLSNQNLEQKLKIKINENELKKIVDNNPFQSIDKPSAADKKQTFSLESLTSCSNLSEPSSSSSGISEQEFSTSSCPSANLIDKKTNLQPNQFNHLNNHHQNVESPNSMQSRCSSNTSYSSDSALGKCSSKQQTNQIKSALKQKISDYKQINCIQKLKQYAFSVNDLHRQLDKKDNDYSTINNNHLLENFNNGVMNEDRNQNDENSHSIQIPKPRVRKSKFELKNKSKLNAMYKSLPNVNEFGSNNQRFGRLDFQNDEDLTKERFDFLNRSDKSTSSEQSVSTIKSNNKTNSSTKLNSSSDTNEARLNWNFHSINEATLVNNYRLINNQDKQNLDAIKKAHIYENLPFQKSVNNLLLNGNRTTPITPANHSFVQAPNLINTTPNRTKIGISALRCSKAITHSDHKNHDLRLNLFNTSLDQRTNLRTCSYQLLNNENLSTINYPNQSTPFKTTRASSDPGVLTYSPSTDNLMRIQSKQQDVFYQNSPSITNAFKLSKNQSPQFDNYQLSFKNLLPLSSRLANNNEITSNNLAYDQPLTNQISNQQHKASSKKKLENNKNFPMRLAESELNLISSNNADQFTATCLLPPLAFSSSTDKKMMIGKLKATSEQQLNKLNTIGNQKLNFKNNKQTDSIDNLQQLKQKSDDLNLPLITALFNDRSLMLPKTVPNCSRQQHQKPKRTSLHLENEHSLRELLNGENPYQQTNLDELDVSKYDNNYNNLDSNNLNKLPAQNSRAEIIDKIWSDHFDHLD